ncbi:unnamed protein product [Meloidogyne enterolobii]|uniref:Uncharacterized protein n=1 Tax=Meloidogyne enterolobii TaxID=390850 RepID=A0ACB0YL60_MELEN
MWQFLIFKVILIVFASYFVNSAMQEKKNEEVKEVTLTIKESDKKKIEKLTGTENGLNKKLLPLLIFNFEKDRKRQIEEVLAKIKLNNPMLIKSYEIIKYVQNKFQTTEMIDNYMDLKANFEKLKELEFKEILDICLEKKEKFRKNQAITKFLEEACNKLNGTLEKFDIKPLNVKENKDEMKKIDQFFSENAKKAVEKKYNWKIIQNISNIFNNLAKKNEESDLEEPLLGHKKED